MRRASTLLLALSAALGALSPAAASAVSLDDVLALLEAGVGEAIIVRQVQAAGADFSVGVQEILRLKENGASDSLIEALMRAAGPEAQEPAIPAEPASSFRIFKEVGPDGREILHITNLDASGRRMGPRQAPEERAPVNQYASRGVDLPRESPAQDAVEGYTVIGDRVAPPVMVNVFPPEPAYAGSYVSPYVYRDPYSYLYPRGRLPGYYPARGWCRACGLPSPPGSYSHFRQYHTHYGGPAPTPAVEGHLGPRYFPVGPASGRASLEYLRSQVRLGGAPPPSHRRPR